MKKFFTMVACAICATTGVYAQDVNHTYDVPAGTEAIDQVLIDQVAADAKANAGADATSYSATINVPAGNYNISGVGEDGKPAGIKLPEGFSVNIVGSEGTVFTLPKSIDIAGTHDFVRFENVEITDGGCQYLINQSTDANLGELSIKGCTIHDFDRSIVRTQNDNAIIGIGNIIVDNSIFTNIASGGGYSVFYFGTAKTTIGKLELSNSTFNTTQKSFIEASKAPITEGIVITNCTFYNNVADGKYLIDANKQNTNITMTATILGKSFIETAKGIRTAGVMAFENCLRTSDCIYASNNIDDLVAGEQSSADIFTDPDNGDFTLKIDTKVGDPRWYKSNAGGDNNNGGDDNNNGGETAINGVNAGQAASNAPVYSLGGQKVGAAAKGIVVKNGKKFLQK